MSDLIDRQRAIDVVDRYFKFIELNGDICIDGLKMLPSAQLKTGKWIPLQLSMAHPPYQCSCCFRNAPMVETGCLMNRHLEALLTDYCSNCGARMLKEGEEHEAD